MATTYEQKTYPNNTPYYEIKINGVFVGHATPVGDKYLATGRRKPVDTLKEAAKQCLYSHMNNCNKEHDKWHRLLNQLLRQNNPCNSGG